MKEEDKFVFVKPTTVWSQRLAEAKKLIEHSNISSEGKKSLEEIFKGSASIMSELESDTWRMLSFAQDLKLELVFSPYKDNKKMIEIEKDYAEKYGDKYTPDKLSKLIEAADKSQMWNYIHTMRCIMNMRLNSLGEPQEYDLYGNEKPISKKV